MLNESILSFSLTLYPISTTIHQIKTDSYNIVLAKYLPFKQIINTVFFEVKQEIIQIFSKHIQINLMLKYLY